MGLRRPRGPPAALPAGARSKVAHRSLPGGRLGFGQQPDGGRTAVIGALVFLVALNLRPAITAVGPLLPLIGNDQHLSESAQGLLGALPVLAFGVVSPLVPRLEERIGPDRSVLTALLGLSGGLILRSYAGPFGLWAGTFVV